MQEHDSTWTESYPWTDPTSQWQHSNKVARLEDLKAVFGFALRRDSDGDGLVDYQELQLNGTSNFVTANPDGDNDLDGYSNLAEALAGTDATEILDKPEPVTPGDLDVFTVFE